jgi:hypothetical protein
MDIFNNRIVIIFISLLWGIGLAILFRKICTNDQCVIVKVPPQFSEVGHVIYSDGKCFKLHKYDSPCVY